MEELGRLLPLLIIWAIYWLVNRRGEKQQQEPVAARKEGGGWVPPEALELPPEEYEFEEEMRPAPFFYRPIPEREVRKPVVSPALATVPEEVCVSHRYRAGVSRRMLRRMFLWSEILASPVGLRDGKENR
jgi:hypothetical protein